MLLGTCTTLIALRDAIAGALRTMSSPPTQTSASIRSLASAASVLSRLSGSRRRPARGSEQHAAIEMDARDVVDGQLALLVGVALRQPLEAVVEADGDGAELDGLDGHRADHAVGARRRPAADDDADAFDCHSVGCSVRSRKSHARTAEVLEALAELAGRQMRRLGEPVDPGGVLEVLGFEPDHVGAGDAVALAAVSTRRTLVLPVSGSRRSSNRIGTSRPPWMLTIAPLPPPSRKRIAL